MPTHYIGNNLPSQPRPTGPSFNESVQNFSLRGILDNRFSGELDRLDESQPDLETRFLEALRSPTSFENFRGELSEFAESVTSDVFGPGGAVQEAMGASGQGVADRGLSPFGGTAQRSRNDILRGATDQVSNAIGQQAGQLASIASQERGNDIRSLLGYTEMQGARADNLRESIFGGQATIDSQGMAREAQDLNEMMVMQALREREGGGGIGGFLGKVGGGLLGSALGPLGAMAGSKIGSALFGDGGGGGGSGLNFGNFDLDTSFFPEDNTNPLFR